MAFVIDQNYLAITAIVTVSLSLCLSLSQLVVLQRGAVYVVAIAAGSFILLIVQSFFHC